MLRAGVSQQSEPSTSGGIRRPQPVRRGASDVASRHESASLRSEVPLGATSLQPLLPEGVCAEGPWPNQDVDLPGARGDEVAGAGFVQGAPLLGSFLPSPLPAPGSRGEGAPGFGRRTGGRAEPSGEATRLPGGATPTARVALAAGFAYDAAPAQGSQVPRGALGAEGAERKRAAEGPAKEKPGSAKRPRAARANDDLPWPGRLNAALSARQGACSFCAVSTGGGTSEDCEGGLRCRAMQKKLNDGGASRRFVSFSKSTRCASLSRRCWFCHLPQTGNAHPQNAGGKGCALGYGDVLAGALYAIWLDDSSSGWRQRAAERFGKVWGDEGEFGRWLGSGGSADGPTNAAAAFLWWHGEALMALPDGSKMDG